MRRFKQLMNTYALKETRWPPPVFGFYTPARRYPRPTVSMTTNPDLVTQAYFCNDGEVLG